MYVRPPRLALRPRQRRNTVTSHGPPGPTRRSQRTMNNRIISPTPSSMADLISSAAYGMTTATGTDRHNAYSAKLRCRRTVHTLRSSQFSRLSAPQPRPADVNAADPEVIEAVRHQIPDSVKPVVRQQKQRRASAVALHRAHLILFGTARYRGSSRLSGRCGSMRTSRYECVCGDGALRPSTHPPCTPTHAHTQG